MNKSTNKKFYNLHKQITNPKTNKRNKTYQTTPEIEKKAKKRRRAAMNLRELTGIQRTQNIQELLVEIISTTNQGVTLFHL